MANQNPSPNTRFQPGIAPNPNGGSRKASERARMKKMIDKQEMEEIGKLILTGNVKKLEAIIETCKKDGKKNASVMKAMFASVALKAIAKGDAAAMNQLLDRLIGKVPVPMQMSSPDGSMRPHVTLLIPDNGRSLESPNPLVKRDADES